MTMQTDAPSGNRSEGALARIEHGFEEAMHWGSEHWAVLLSVLIVLLVGGGAVAGFYEWSRAQRAQAFTDLAAIERELAEALPAGASEIGAPKPANPEIAEKAQLAALEAFGDLSRERSGTAPGFFAGVRAAEMEVDLGRFEDAEKRLAALLETPGDPIARATALRLRGYTLEELERPLEAAQVYMEAGGIEAYPARGDAYWQAGTTYERLGELESAISAYDAAISVAPKFAEQNRIEDRLRPLRARLEKAKSVPPASNAAGATEAAEEELEPAPEEPVEQGPAAGSTP